jgi:signal transduction histidine kinase
MRVDLTLLAALIAFGVGFMAFWSNPERAINRLFLALSIHAAFWLFALRMSFVSDDGLIWVRIASAIGAFIPLHLRFIKETVVRGEFTSGQSRSGSLVWTGVSFALAGICFTDWFVPAHSTSVRKLFGPAYYGYIGGIVLTYGWLCVDAVRQMRKQVGVRRLELQILLLGSSATALTVLFLMGLRTTLELPWLERTQPVFVLLFYSATTIAITTHRIFDARQLALFGVQNLALIGLVSGCAYLTYLLLEQMQVPPILAFVLTTGFAVWLAAELRAALGRVFHFYPEETAVRQAAFAVARREAKVDDLEAAFLAILKGWGHCDRALILTANGEMFRSSGIELPGDGPELRALRHLRWVTPERLSRERSTPERQALGRFLQNHGLGAVVIGEGPAMTVLVCVGVPLSRRPFTYPQITQLVELASIVESALERAHFATKVQHAEQLATVGLLGASLAHEIRNPLVSIKTFVQLLPTHYQDPNFRTKFFKLIGDEVNRIDRLTEQLLDLASPRVYAAEMVELHPVLQSSLDLVVAKASDKRTRFIAEFQAKPDVAWTDASAAKQVMLNLCFNAIQAVEGREGERWVRIATRNVATGVEMTVADSGPGISEEIRPRLFQPFQSTKSTGFGLGLAICSDILANLDATITVDPAVPGQGATFRVTFPCQPLSS